MTDFINKEGRKALVKVAEWLEAGAPHVDENGRRIDKFDMNFEVVTTPECGTSCCIAGAVYQFEELEGFYGVIPAVKDFIGISDEDSEKLFFPWEALSEEHEQLEHNPVPFSDPAVAAKTIRTYLETGEIDWIGSGLEIPKD